MSRKRMSVIMAGALCAIVFAPTLSADRSLYDTKRVLEHLGNECGRVPGCQSVESQPVHLNADQVKVIVVDCPSTYPFVWQWDTRQHEHMQVKLVSRNRSALTLSVSNLGDASGAAQIFIGCSSEPFKVAGVGFMTSRTGVPSRALNMKEHRHGDER
jgi:hypothetical protein